MRLVAEAAFLIIFCALIFLGWLAAQQFLKPKKSKAWSVKRIDKAHDQTTEFWLIKAPDQAEFVGRCSRARDDYADRLLELQDQAEEKMYNWNSAEKVLKS